ncbi:putative pentatricopeptide repeat-containing protein, mitochondrial-like [Capsicum annuum]|nr:putative pentatricopeptide repeat-containing protein, mitochondrial-like [Capsicum annuum]
MPVGYQPPKFQQFGGKRNSRQHIAYFIETCSSAGTHVDLFVKQFVRSLKDNAFDWYTDLESESIDYWEQLKRMPWGLVYILQGIKPRTFKELTTCAHDMELSIASYRMTSPIFDPRKEVMKFKVLSEDQIGKSMTITLQAKEVIEFPKSKRPEKSNKVDDPKYYKFHHIVGHHTTKCFILKEKIMTLMQKGKIIIDDGDTVDVNHISIELDHKKSLVIKKAEKMDLFYKAKAVRLRSYHEKYLTAEEDEETVIQDRDGASKNATWTVEFINSPEKYNIIRLKSCYNKYLTASNQRFLLGMTGRKVLQTLPQRLDSSIEWEPIREGHQVKLRTKQGQFLRANDSIPPWRNSVTHNIPHRTSTQDWILWDVDVVEILVHSPVPKEPPPLVYHDHEGSNLGSESISRSSSVYSASAASFSRQESEEFLASSLIKFGDGRLIYYHIANEYGEINEGVEGVCIPFKGNSVEELTKILEEETGLEDITVCTKSSLNGKLYPLHLQLPPNNANMDVVVVPSGLI